MLILFKKQQSPQKAQGRKNTKCIKSKKKKTLVHNAGPSSSVFIDYVVTFYISHQVSLYYSSVSSGPTLAGQIQRSMPPRKSTLPPFNHTISNMKASCQLSTLFHTRSTVLSSLAVCFSITSCFNSPTPSSPDSASHQAPICSNATIINTYFASVLVPSCNLLHGYYR